MVAAGAEVAASAQPKQHFWERGFLWAKPLGPFSLWTGSRVKLFRQCLGKEHSLGISMTS